VLEIDTSEANDPCVPTERSSAADGSALATEISASSYCCLRDRLVTDDGLLGSPSGRLEGVDGPLLAFLLGCPDIVLCSGSSDTAFASCGDS